MRDERRAASDYPLPTSDYDLLEILDRLESLAEDMDDLRVRTRDEVERLMALIHARLDEMDDEQ